MKQKRIYLWDNTKFLLIAVVVTLVLSLKPCAFPTKWIMSLKERNTTTGSMII